MEVFSSDGSDMPARTVKTHGEGSVETPSRFCHVTEQEGGNSELKVRDGEERIESDGACKVGDGSLVLTSGGVDQGRVEEYLGVVADLLHRPNKARVSAERRQETPADLERKRTSNRASAESYSCASKASSAASQTSNSCLSDIGVVRAAEADRLPGPRRWANEASDGARLSTRAGLFDGHAAPGPGQ